MADGLEVISSGLFDSLVCRNGSITSGTGQILAVFVRDVLSFRVFEAFGQSKVDNEDVIFCRFGATDEEVVRFDISVDYTLLVDFLYTGEKPDGDQQDRFQVEVAATRRKEVFQGRPQLIHDHHIKRFPFN